MTAIYLFKGDKVLLLFRQGGSVVNNVWTGSAGGHFEEFELNDAKACYGALLLNRTIFRYAICGCNK